jgi:ATP-dependent DNA helicase DinG
MQFREKAGSLKIDIQVCNHNYLLADILRRADDKRPLIPNYQSIIIDEAHKFLSAARSMYGLELSYVPLLEIKYLSNTLKFKHESAQKQIRKMAAQLSSAGSRLFRKLEEKAVSNQTDDEADRFPAVINEDNQRHIRVMRDISDELIRLLIAEPLAGNGAGRKAQLISELEHINEQSAALVRHNDYICWYETDKSDRKICAIPKDLNTRLFDDLWNKGIPTILTSATLSVAGDFTNIKRALGLEGVSKYRLTEISKRSPFDYHKNALMYISENVPFPDLRNENYILSVTSEIEKLVNASHGHAAVLFTSYKAMDKVWGRLKDREITFPMFRLDKGGVLEMERFKQSGNGILFAAGSLWEGIDIPGDALSMLIIVKLPFSVPDPISEYERTLYRDMDEYKELVITPEMLIKAKQGAGRSLRTETDTAVIAFIDCRVSKDGAFRMYLLEALWECDVTDCVVDVTNFYRNKKSPEYFI